VRWAKALQLTSKRVDIVETLQERKEKTMLAVTATVSDSTAGISLEEAE